MACRMNGTHVARAASQRAAWAAAPKWVAPREEACKAVEQAVANRLAAARQAALVKEHKVIEPAMLAHVSAKEAECT